MKNLFKLFTILVALGTFGFVFSSGDNGQSSTGIVNYYYYQGQKFYMQPRTDVVFLKFKNDLSENAAREVLSRYPQIDLSRSSVNLNDDNFIRLNSRLDDASYTELIKEMKRSAELENVNIAYNPSGYEGDKFFYGMNDYLILQYKRDISSGQIESMNRTNGVELVQRIDVTGGETYLAKVTQSSGKNAMEMSNKYFEDGLVNYSEPSLYATNVLCDTVNDPFYPMQWGLRNTGSNIPGNPGNGIADADMDVDSAWNITKGDSTLIVAVLDTGVDTTHPDINLSFGYDFVNDDGNPNDDGNHGTCCAGIISAKGNNSLGVAGVAYKCKIMPVKVINSSGNIPGYHVAAFGTIYAYQNGAQVLSNSWGYVGGNSNLMYNSIQDAARYGRNGKGSIVCFASGNENTSPMRFPAISDANMVVVGGNTPCNKRKSPSDGCSGETWGACFGPTLDIVAPCVKIYSTDRVGAAGYTSSDYQSAFNGTSSATPMAAGVCALVLSANNNLTRLEVESIISKTAEKVGTYSYATIKEYGGWNNEMGYGMINARLALQMVSNDFDFVKPEIFHDNPLQSGNDSLARQVTAIIKDNKKLASGTNQPRLYYRKNGEPFTFINAGSIVADTFKFTIPGFTTGTTVEYYFAAQDTVTVPNMITLPNGGFGTNPPGSTAPLTTFWYKIGNYKTFTSTTTPRVVLNNSTSYDTIMITGFTGTVLDVDVKLSVSSRDNQDEDMYLIKESLQSELSTDNGGTNDSYVNTIFDDEATINITAGSSPFTGRYKPETPLTVFDGLSVNGMWIFRLTDDAAAGANVTIDGWSLEITYSTLTGVVNTIVIPSTYGLSQNYPNPFNPSTVINYSLPKNGDVKLTLFDLTGKEIGVLVNGHHNAGSYEYELNASSLGLSSGIYFYRIDAGEFTDVKRMMLIK